MISFDFKSFHLNWGQELVFKREEVGEDFDTIRRTQGKASFIVQEIKEESIRIEYNILGQDSKSFYSDVHLSVNDVIVFQNKDYKIVGKIDQYPNGESIQYCYLGSVVS